MVQTSATDFMHLADADRSDSEAKVRHEPISSAWQIPAEAIEESLSVQDFMTKDPVLVAPGATIGALARII